MIAALAIILLLAVAILGVVSQHRSWQHVRKGIAIMAEYNALSVERTEKLDPRVARFDSLNLVEREQLRADIEDWMARSDEVRRRSKVWRAR